MNEFYVPRLLAVFFFIQSCCYGQSPVNNVSIISNIAVPGGTLNQNITSHPNSVNTVQPSTSYNVSYTNDGNVNIIDFTLSGNTYIRFDNFDTVILRRVANTWETTGGNKQQIYCQGPLLVDNLFHTLSFPPAFPVVTNHAYMERVMKEGLINRGSDNVFNNDPNSDATSNNIERVDFVYKEGIATTDTALAGFLIAERGGNDPFKIAAITGINADGDPTSFGPVLSVGTGSYGTTIMSATTYVLRKDPADNTLRPFSQVPLQNVRAVFISFKHLSIAPMQTIYGYALMANDVTASTSAQIMDYTNNTYFPRITTTVNGGMDLAAAPGIFHTDLVLAGHYLNLTTQTRNCDQLIQWNDKEFDEVKEYQVERSFDLENFERIHAQASGEYSGYSFTDNNSSTISYYRLKVILQRGGFYYSNTILSNKTCSIEKVSLYPNPVQDQLTITIGNATRITEMIIYSITGREFGKWQLNGNEQQVKIDLSVLPKGQYFVRLKDGSGSVKGYPVLKL